MLNGETTAKAEAGKAEVELEGRTSLSCSSTTAADIQGPAAVGRAGAN
jgi:hypothetical protein